LISQPELSSAIKAAAVGHPAFLVNDDAAQIKRPILFICAETDHTFPADMREYFEKTLMPTGLATFIDYPGTVHGFVTRPNDTELSKKQSDKAVHDAIEFFKKNL
jgi:carboxymethylenebutenolidase